jgi:nicotinate-nucleotide adenylyltransferase
MKRVGIFGGSFNPVHHAHVMVARAAQEALGLDEVVFVPCARSAHGKKLMPAALRLRMLRAALRGMVGFRLSDVEIKRGGMSRSIDTLEAFTQESAPGTKFFLLIGQDQVAQFSSWKDADRLSQLSKICVMTRPGYRKNKVTHKKFHMRVINVPQYEISSTLIRLRLKKNLPVDGMASSSVLKILKVAAPQL